MTNRIHREVIGGHLLVIGGAEDKYNERRILRKFLELTGNDGGETQILIVPVASDFPEFAADIYVQAFRRLGVANPRVLRATSRQDVFAANADELLDGVKGVFMTSPSCGFSFAVSGMKSPPAVLSDASSMRRTITRSCSGLIVIAIIVYSPFRDIFNNFSLKF